MHIEAVPTCNLVQERARGQKYHPRGQFSGYVATFRGCPVYIAGDTERIPEMGQLGPIDLAFIPINLPFTMPPGSRRLHQGDLAQNHRERSRSSGRAVGVSVDHLVLPQHPPWAR